MFDRTIFFYTLFQYASPKCFYTYSTFVHQKKHLNKNWLTDILNNVSFCTSLLCIVLIVDHLFGSVGSGRFGQDLDRLSVHSTEVQIQFSTNCSTWKAWYLCKMLLKLRQRDFFLTSTLAAVSVSICLHWNSTAVHFLCCSLVH